MENIKEILDYNKDILSDDEMYEYLVTRKIDEEFDDLVEFKKFNFTNISHLIYKFDGISQMIKNGKNKKAIEELNLLKRQFINDLMDLKYEE